MVFIMGALSVWSMYSLSKTLIDPFPTSDPLASFSKGVRFSSRGFSVPGMAGGKLQYLPTWLPLPGGLVRS